MADVNFHWRHLKERNWIQESVDRCIVLFCFLYSRLNGKFDDYDYSMERLFYKSFFKDLIQKEKINQGGLWQDGECRNFLQKFTNGEKIELSKDSKFHFFEKLSEYVRFHMKGARRYTFLFLLLFVLAVLTGFSAGLSFRKNLYFNFATDIICSVVSLFGIAYFFVRNLVIRRRSKSLKLRYIFTEIDYEFCFEKLSEEIEFINKTYRYVYDILEELRLRRTMLIKDDGFYRLNVELSKFLNYISEFYYDAEYLFTPKFISENIRNSKGEVIKEESVSQHRSRKRGEEKDIKVW